MIVEHQGVETSLSIRDAVERFLLHLEQRGAASLTVEAYRSDLLQLVGFIERTTGHPATLRELDGAALTGHLEALGRDGYAPATVARKRHAMRSFCHFLTESGWLATDLSAGIGYAPIIPPTPMVALDSRSLARLLGAVEGRDGPEDRRDAAILRVLCETGVTISEMVRLDLGDIRPADAVRPSELRIRGRRNSVRVVPLTASAVRSLVAYLTYGRPVLVRRVKEQPALFVNQRGGRLTRQGLWLILRARVREADLPATITPHTFRTSFAAQRLRAGTELKELGALLGYASVSSARRYRRIEICRPSEPTRRR